VGGYLQPAHALFRLVARDYGGELTANTLYRFVAPPEAVSYRDTAGITRLDTLPRFIGGHVVARVDTVLARSAGPVVLRLHRTAEAWDPASATWALRVDTAGARLPWSTPGGTAGALLDTAIWTPGTDSVIFAVDSATVAAWAALDDPARGALLSTPTPETRLELTSLVMRYQARPSARPDTVVTAVVGAVGSTFVLTPAAPAGSELRVGGVPSWRSFVTFHDGFTQATVPCPGAAPPGCVIRLADATVNHAALVLQTRPAPPAFAPAGPLALEARVVHEGPLLPLARAPVGDTVGRLPTAVLPGVFAGEPTDVELPVTRFVAALLAGTPVGGGEGDPPRSMVLIALPQVAQFGLATFAGLAGPGTPPRLRLIVTIAGEGVTP
jgi:hypothetical protein